MLYTSRMRQKTSAQPMTARIRKIPQKSSKESCVLSFVRSARQEEDSLNLYTHTHTHTHTHIHIYIHTYTYTCNIYIHVICIHKIHTQTHTYTHTHTHTHTHTPVVPQPVDGTIVTHISKDLIDGVKRDLISVKRDLIHAPVSRFL